MILHVRLGKRQGADLRVGGLPFQKVTAQKRQLLERDLVFANQTQIDADRKWCAPAIGINTVEQKLPDIAFVVETGHDIFHKNLFFDPKRALRVRDESMRARSPFGFARAAANDDHNHKAGEDQQQNKVSGDRHIVANRRSGTRDPAIHVSVVGKSYS